MLDQCGAGAAIAGDYVQHARRQTCARCQLSEQQRVSGVYSRASAPRQLPSASAGAIFHEGISSGKFTAHLADHAQRRPVGELATCNCAHPA